MSYEFEVFRHQYPLVMNFTRNLTYARAVARIMKSERLESRFWGATGDAHMMQAALHWCMVFGSHGTHNHTHLLNLRGRNHAQVRRAWLGSLLIHLKITQTKWRDYHGDILHFRNNYAAHRALADYDRPTPVWDLALETAFFYDDWIRHQIAPDQIDGPTLRAQAAELSVAVEPMLVATIRAGMNLKGKFGLEGVMPVGTRE